MTELVKRGGYRLPFAGANDPGDHCQDINKALASPDLNNIALHGQRCVEEKFP